MTASRFFLSGFALTFMFLCLSKARSQNHPVVPGDHGSVLVPDPSAAESVAADTPAVNTVPLASLIRRSLPRGFEEIRNRVSNIDFRVSNYGPVGQNTGSGNAGLTWPRGSSKPYLSGGGFWFGAKKRVEDTLKKYSVISFNPAGGASWFVPGRIEGPYRESVMDQSLDAVNNYGVYSSAAYNLETGEEYGPPGGTGERPNWPVWDTDPGLVPGENHYFGSYIPSTADRNLGAWSKGPAIISDEDMVAVFKDTDPDYYEIGRNAAEEEGYPLGIQVEQQVFSWFFPADHPLKDVMMIRYKLINMSEDTLYDAYFSPVYDIDIGEPLNDRARIVIADPDEDSLDLATGWSETTGGDQQFGYIGVDLLQSPAVYGPGESDAGFSRTDKIYYPNSEQIGLASFRNWVEQGDPATPEERYDFFATRFRDGDTGPGERRMGLSTGPFHMRPGDTVVVAVGLIFAPSLSGIPNGSWDDLQLLIELDRSAQVFWDTFTRTNSVEEAWRVVRSGRLDLR